MSGSLIELLSEEPFLYSEAERSIEGVWGGVRFELSKTPKQLLLLGAQFGSSVSRYAWRAWKMPWGEVRWNPVLLFDDATGEFLDNALYALHDSKSLQFELDWGSDCDWEEIEERSGISIGDAIIKWLEDDATAI